jgi:hypothetical protein
MSELLYDWLNKEVKMIPKIEDIRKEFASGFKFGELLCKLNLITDFHFSENYSNLKDYYFSIKKIVSSFIKDIKEHSGIDITYSMIKQYTKENLIASSFIY